MVISEQKIRRFVSQLNSKYEQESMLSEYEKLLSYDEDEHDYEFIQIGRRTNLPKRFFSEGENYSNIEIASQFARSIATGEKTYITNSIADSEETVAHQAQNGLEFDDIIQAYHQLPDPDHIFIPIFEEFYDTVTGWVQEKGNVKFESINIGDSEIKIHWLPTDSEIRDVVIIDSGYLPIIRKEGGQSTPPDGVDVIEDYEKFSVGKPVICTFGEDAEEFDFVYRTVLYLLPPTEYSGYTIRIPSSFKLTP